MFDYNYINSNKVNNKDIYFNNDIMKRYISFKSNSYNYNHPSLYNISNDIYNLLQSNSLDIYSKLDVIQSYSRILRSVTQFPWKDGEISYINPQMLIYYYYVKDYINKYKKEGVINLCEVGFQFGAGALVMMLPNIKKIHLLAFSLDKKHSRMSYEYLSNNFNMKIEWGNSLVAIPNYNFDKVKCDIIHIDGCHSVKCIKADISNLQSHVNKKNILLADDVDSNHPAWKEMKENSVISETKCFGWKPFCIGKYI